MKYITLLTLPILFTSCNAFDGIGSIGLTILFAVLMLSMIGMYFYVARKRKQVENTVNGFSAKVSAMLSNIEGAENKVAALNQLIDRINSDEKYKKNTVWRDKVLSKVYQHLSTVYFASNNHQKVIETCTEVIRVEPGHMMSFYNRGSLYYNMGMYEKAVADLTEAINLDASFANSFNNRGMIYERLGELDKAATDFGYAISLEETAISYYNRANTYALLNEKEKATADYQKALELDIDGLLKEDIQIALAKIS